MANIICVLFANKVGRTVRALSSGLHLQATDNDNLGQLISKRQTLKINGKLRKYSTTQTSQRAKLVIEQRLGKPSIAGLGFLSNTQLRNYSDQKMIVYSRVSKTDSSAVCEHLFGSFFKHEPFGLALGLTLDQVEQWYGSFMDEILAYNQPVSFMAKDVEKNKIVGVAINIIIDESGPPPPPMKKYITKEKQPVKWQIATFLEDLEAGVDPVKLLNMDASKQNKMLACLFLSVEPEYGGRGLAKTLLRESEQEAKQIEGVTIAMTEVTSQYSYLATQKMGYKTIHEVKYMDYKDPDGVPIFEGLAEKLGVHTHARVVAKPL